MTPFCRVRGHTVCINVFYFHFENMFIRDAFWIIVIVMTVSCIALIAIRFLYGEMALLIKCIELSIQQRRH